MSFDDALRQVHKRLDDFQTSDDPDVVLCAAATDEADTLWQAMRDADQRQTAAAYHALGWLAYLRYNELPRGADQPELALALTLLKPFADIPRLLPERMRAALGPGAVPATQAGLATGLLQHAQSHDDRLVLEAAIDLLTKAVAATSAEDPGRCDHLGLLAAAHGVRFDRTGQLADAQQAIALGEAALAETPYGAPERAGRLYNLRGSYQARFNYTGDLSDLERGIALGEQTLAATPPGDRDRLRFLSNIALAYQARFERLGDAEDLERAIDMGTEAVAGTPEDSPQRARVVSGLRSAYRTRYRASGHLADLERAIDLGEQAVAAAGDGHPERVRYLANLGGMYADRFDRLGATPDLTHAIELNEQALREAPPDHSDRPSMLSNLAIKYRTRFERFGDPADLDRAIEAGEQSVASTPDGHSSAAGRLSTLEAAYSLRYGYFGALNDLNRGIELGERALAGTPQSHPSRFLYELGLCGGYTQRFARTQAVADLDRAVELGEAAAAGAPQNRTERVSALINLANAYATRFEAAPRTRRFEAEPTDLDRAIELTEQVLVETPDDHPERPSVAALLGRRYQSRFTAGGRFDHLQRAVELHEEALAATPDDHPDLAATAAGLARAYMSWANMVFREDIDRTKVRAIAARAARAEAASPASRVNTGLVVGALAMVIDDPETAADAFDRAVAVLPSVAPSELDRADQEHNLGDHFALAAEAISAHLALGDPAGAVAAAEASRGILLAERLNSRTELDVLGRVAPDLARELADLRAALNAPATGNTRQLWARHDQLVADIRAQDGMADFLRLPQPAELTRAAAGGAVVLLNMGITRHDAVVITADAEPRAVELPNDVFLPHRRAEALIDATQARSSLANTLRRQRVVGDALRWLWDEMVGPVLATLPDGPEPHRIWWLPVGYLSAFPLHAAGYPGETGALDRTVSSYVPTLRSLDHVRRRPGAAVRRQLIVDLSHTPDLTDLPGTAAEAAELHARHPDGPRLSNQDATVANVLAGLQDSTWTHFACHANADLTVPSQSGLRLHDGTLLLRKISELRLGHAELAYLSACSTARIGPRHANESIHLASAFQLAGFRHVIASLWPLGDEIGATAARMFYEGLPDGPDANAAAATLRAVTLRLRESYPDRPDLWASLVHSGP